MAGILSSQVARWLPAMLALFVGGAVLMRLTRRSPAGEEFPEPEPGVAGDASTKAASAGGDAVAAGRGGHSQGLSGADGVERFQPPVCPVAAPAGAVPRADVAAQAPGEGEAPAEPPGGLASRHRPLGFGEPRRSAEGAEEGRLALPVNAYPIGSARRLRDAYRAQAATDPAGFAQTARGTIVGGATLPEKMETLRAAEEAAPVLADAIYEAALGPEVPDAALREAAADRLLRLLRRPRPPLWAWQRLHASVVSDPRQPPDLRRRSAPAVFASAPEADLPAMIAAAERDPAIWRDAVLGLARHSSPRARELLADAIRGRWWEPEVQALAADPGELGAPADPAQGE